MTFLFFQHGIYNAQDKYQRLEENPFKSETKCMSVKVKNKKVSIVFVSSINRFRMVIILLLRMMNAVYGDENNSGNMQNSFCLLI